MLDLTEAFKNESTLNSFKEKLLREVNNNYQAWWVSYFDDIESLTAEDFEHKSLYQWFIDINGVRNCDAIYRLEDEYEFGMKKEFGDDIKLMHKNKTGRNSSDELYSPEMRKLVTDKESQFIKEFGY